MTDNQLQAVLAEIRGLRELFEQGVEGGALPNVGEGKRRKALPPSPEWVTQAEVAAYLCVSVMTVSRNTRRGCDAWPYRLLRRVEFGGRVLYTRASFSHMQRAMKTAAEADHWHN
jgi:hypothetical protein